jgi:DNA replication initiation complex subunit (GINS family)
MAEQENKEDKKIIIDEDWKVEAQKEKERLAAQEDAERKEAEAQQRQHGPLPPGDFAALISMLTTQAFFALGLLEVHGQEGEQRQPDLAMAQYNIDMLQTLQDKTKGNLTKEEQKVLSNMLNQLRMAYVKVSDSIK